MWRPQRSHKLLLLAFTLLINTVTSLVNLQTTAQNLSQSPTDEMFKCYSGHVISPSQRASTQNCLGASFFIPLAHQEGQFYVGNRDIYGLPFKKQIEDCVIDVSMEGGRTELTTWTSVGLRINQLIGACTNGNFPDGVTGGETKAGVGQNIVIKIGRPEPSDTSGNTGDGMIGDMSVER